MIRAHKIAALGIGGLAALSVGLTACSSNPSISSSPTPLSHETKAESKSPTATTTAASGAPCTKEALQAALPSGSTVIAFKCDGGYAAVSAAPEAWPIFKAEGSTWKSTGLDCSSASASSLPNGVYKQICTK